MTNELSLVIGAWSLDIRAPGRPEPGTVALQRPKVSPSCLASGLQHGLRRRCSVVTAVRVKSLDFVNYGRSRAFQL